MSKEQFWDREKTLLLIKLYEQHSLLWNPPEESYKMKNKRNDSLKAIATEIGTDVDFVKKKIDSLLAQYRREKRNVETKSGMGTDEKKKTWWGLKYFAFLNDKFEPRPTYSSLKTQPHQQDREDSDVMVEDDDEDIDVQIRAPSSASRSSKCEYHLPPKRISKKDEAFYVMKDCYNELKQGSTVRDALSIYGENVANRLKNIRNRRRRLIAMNKIDNLLLEAEIEEEDELASTRSPASRASSTDPGLPLLHPPFDAGEDMTVADQGTHSQSPYLTFTQLSGYN